MKIRTLSKNTRKMAKVAIIIIFLALIRTLIEPFRLLSCCKNKPDL